MSQSHKKLTGKQARYLRSLGHSLKPLLQVGKTGITDNFIDQARKTLDTHELIKIKLGKSSPANMEETTNQLTSKIPCQLAQSIGKTLLLYKQKEEDPQIILPE